MNSLRTLYEITLQEISVFSQDGLSLTDLWTHVEENRLFNQKLSDSLKSRLWKFLLYHPKVIIKNKEQFVDKELVGIDQSNCIVSVQKDLSLNIRHIPTDQEDIYSDFQHQTLDIISKARYEGITGMELCQKLNKPSKTVFMFTRSFLVENKLYKQMITKKENNRYVRQNVFYLYDYQPNELNYQAYCNMLSDKIYAYLQFIDKDQCDVEDFLTYENVPKNLKPLVKNVIDNISKLHDSLFSLSSKSEKKKVRYLSLKEDDDEENGLYIDPDYRTFLTSLLPSTSFLERLLYFFSIYQEPISLSQLSLIFGIPTKSLTRYIAYYEKSGVIQTHYETVYKQNIKCIKVNEHYMKNFIYIMKQKDHECQLIPYKKESNSTTSLPPISRDDQPIKEEPEVPSSSLDVPDSEPIVSSSKEEEEEIYQLSKELVAQKDQNLYDFGSIKKVTMGFTKKVYYALKYIKQHHIVSATDYLTYIRNLDKSSMMDKRTFTRIMSLLISRKDISNIKLSTTTTQKRILSVNIYCDGVKTEQDPDVQAYIQQLVNEPAPTKSNAVLCSIFNAPMELLEQVILVPMLFIEHFPDYYQSKSDRCFSVYHYINAFTLYQLVCLFGMPKDASYSLSSLFDANSPHMNMTLSELFKDHSMTSTIYAQLSLYYYHKIYEAFVVLMEFGFLFPQSGSALPEDCDDFFQELSDIEKNTQFYFNETFTIEDEEDHPQQYPIYQMDSYCEIWKLLYFQLMVQLYPYRTANTTPASSVITYIHFNPSYFNPQFQPTLNDYIDAFIFTHARKNSSRMKRFTFLSDTMIQFTQTLALAIRGACAHAKSIGKQKLTLEVIKSIPPPSEQEAKKKKSKSTSEKKTVKRNAEDNEPAKKRKTSKKTTVSMLNESSVLEYIHDPSSLQQYYQALLSFFFTTIQLHPIPDSLVDSSLVYRPQRYVHMDWTAFSNSLSSTVDFVKSVYFRLFDSKNNTYDSSVLLLPPRDLSFLFDYLMPEYLQWTPLPPTQFKNYALLYTIFFILFSNSDSSYSNNSSLLSYYCLDVFSQKDIKDMLYVFLWKQYLLGYGKSLLNYSFKNSQFSIPYRYLSDSLLTELGQRLETLQSTLKQDYAAIFTRTATSSSTKQDEYDACLYVTQLPYQSYSLIMNRETQVLSVTTTSSSTTIFKKKRAIPSTIEQDEDEDELQDVSTLSTTKKPSLPSSSQLYYVTKMDSYLSSVDDVLSTLLYESPSPSWGHLSLPRYTEVEEDRELILYSYIERYYLYAIIKDLLLEANMNGILYTEIHSRILEKVTVPFQEDYQEDVMYRAMNCALKDLVKLKEIYLINDVSMHRYIAAIYIQHYSLPQLLPSNAGPTKVPPTSKESSTILLHSHFIALKKDEEMSNQYKCTYDILYTILCNPGITFNSLYKQFPHYLPIELMDVCNSLRKQRAIDIKIVHNSTKPSLFSDPNQLTNTTLLSFYVNYDIHVVDNTNYAMFPLPSSFEFLVKYKNAHIRYF